MKGLRKALTPFAPDQSGAVSVLYELGGIIVVLDAGGCTGNICGFDEPRWHTTRSAVFSAGLRDMDAILGRDTLLVKKLVSAAGKVDATFAALIGTPVPAVIGTDLKALSRMAEKQLDIPVIAVSATGLKLYDVGMQTAYEALFEKFCSERKEKSDMRVLGILGVTPLDFPEGYVENTLYSYARNKGYDDILVYGGASGISGIKDAGTVQENLVVSPGGLSAAKLLFKRYETPYTVYAPVPEEIFAKCANPVDGGSFETAGKTLIVHQQVIASSLRSKLRKQVKEGNFASSRERFRIDVASWFEMDAALLEGNDVHLTEEDDFTVLVKKENYDTICADMALKALVPDFSGKWIDLPHFALSGRRHV